MSKQILESKRFVIRKTLVGKNQLIKVNFANGDVAEYNHDEAYELMKDKLASMNCYIKYKSYTSSASVPVIARSIAKITKAAVIESVLTVGLKTPSAAFTNFADKKEIILSYER